MDNELITFDKTEPKFKNLYFNSFCNNSQAKGNTWKICRLKYGKTRNLVVMESSKVGGIDGKDITGNEMSEFVFLWSESARTKDYCFIRTLPGLDDMDLK
uniref:Uncharacterized protein n=1 Tax=Romanomermis culicivorax TaxID=13658 RepID=A0A915HRN9_ROMCU